MRFSFRYRSQAAAGLLVAATLLAAGCRTVPERLDHGRALMGSGEYHAAAEYFLAILDENPDDRQARSQLFTAGNRAIEQLLVEAEAASHADRHDAAVDRILAVDTLRERAIGHGVSLQIPIDYPHRRRAAFDGKIASLIARGQELADARAWREALEAYERVTDDLEPDSEQSDRILASRARILIDWAHEEYEAGRYRTARALSVRATDAAAVNSSLLEEVLDLRLMIEDEGALRVALVPMPDTDGDDVVLEAALTTAYEHAKADTLPFTRIINPDDVRRELRRVRPAREALTTPVLIEIATAVDADVLVLAEREPAHRNAPAMSLKLELFDARQESFIEAGRFYYRPLDASVDDAQVEMSWESGAEVPQFTRRKPHERTELIGYAHALRKMILTRVAAEVE